MKIKNTVLMLNLVKKGLTLMKLSELTGVSKATISAVKNGKTCSFRTASKIAKVLDLDVVELIEEV